VTIKSKVSLSECQLGNTISKPTKKSKFSHEKIQLPSVPPLEMLLGNAFMNISSSKNIRSIPQKGTLRIAESQPTNLVGLQMVSRELFPS
jgi:hypothetical protein